MNIGMIKEQGFLLKLARYTEEFFQNFITNYEKRYIVNGMGCIYN